MSSSPTRQCKVCARRIKNVVVHYNPDNHALLGVKHLTTIWICDTCDKKIRNGEPLALATTLPLLVNKVGQREKGLFVSKIYETGEPIAQYWGKNMTIEEARENPSFFMWEHVPRRTVIDAHSVHCLAKYANNTVH